MKQLAVAASLAPICGMLVWLFGGRAIPGGPFFSVVADIIVHLLVAIGIATAFPQLRGRSTTRFIAFGLICALAVISAVSISEHIAFAGNPYARGRAWGW